MYIRKASYETWCVCNCKGIDIISSKIASVVIDQLYTENSHVNRVFLYEPNQHDLHAACRSELPLMRFLSIECYWSYCAESARYFQQHSFFITYYTLLILILCTTLRTSVFNKELLTYLLLLM